MVRQLLLMLFCQKNEVKMRFACGMQTPDTHTLPIPPHYVFTPL